MSKRTVEQLVQTAANLTPEAKKTIRDAGNKISKGAALKISRLPPDQQEEAAAILTIAPPAPKRQGMMDSEAALTEFKALCSRYVSGIEALRADIFAGMTISQFDALGDSAYSTSFCVPSGGWGGAKTAQIIMVFSHDPSQTGRGALPI